MRGEPYRAARATRQLMPACIAGDHQVRVLVELKGGEGPDEASDYIECMRGCGSSGWRYCDGSLKWDQPWDPKPLLVPPPRMIHLGLLGHAVLKAGQIVIGLCYITALFTAGIGAKLLGLMPLEGRRKEHDSR